LFSWDIYIFFIASNSNKGKKKKNSTNGHEGLQQGMSLNRGVVGGGDGWRKANKSGAEVSGATIQEHELGRLGLNDDFFFIFFNMSTQEKEKQKGDSN
jgi:hypothetical protein